ncbi:hypothetical protein SI859A1_03715, partial [Aurantimonas manganoxydans SI85-9A1]
KRDDEADDACCHDRGLPLSVTDRSGAQNRRGLRRNLLPSRWKEKGLRPMRDDFPMRIAQAGGAARLQSQRAAHRLRRALQLRPDVAAQPLGRQREGRPAAIQREGETAGTDGQRHADGVDLALPVAGRDDEAQRPEILERRGDPRLHRRPGLALAGRQLRHQIGAISVRQAGEIGPSDGRGRELQMAADVEIDRMGLFLFTTRNGDAADLKAGGGLSSTLDWPSFYKV